MGDFGRGNRGGFGGRSSGGFRGSRGGFGGRGGDRGDRGGFGSRGGFGRGGDRERKEMHDAICDKCKKECQVPFRPSGDKPVLCSDCFRNSANFSSGSGSPRAPNLVSPQASSAQLAQINQKLDKIIAILGELELDTEGDDEDLAEDLDEDEGEEIEVSGDESEDEDEEEESEGKEKKDTEEDESLEG